MIRLSCWIGGVGRVLGEEAMAKHGDQPVAPVMHIPAATRCIDADIDVDSSDERLRFASAAPRLLRHFRHLKSEEESEEESSVDEIRETWRRCRDRLMAPRQDCAEISGNDRKGAEKAPCLNDAG